jgi:hypothetical protein
MSPDTGMKLVLLAGTMTFGNEWYQTKEINWRVPVATVLAAAAVAGIGRVSPNGAGTLGVMALIAAAATPLNGKSPIQELRSVVDSRSSTAKTTRTTNRRATPA